MPRRQNVEMRVPGVHAQRIAIALQVIGFETVVESLHSRAVPRKVDRRIRADLLGYLARVNEQVAGPRWAHHDRRDLPQEAGEMVVDGIDVFPAELYGPNVRGRSSTLQESMVFPKMLAMINGMLGDGSGWRGPS